MPPKTIRFPDALAEKIQARADATDRSFSYVVLRALESALGERERFAPEGRAGHPRKTADVVAAESASRSPAPTRAPRVPGVKTVRELAMDRQAKLNEAKS